MKIQPCYFCVFNFIVGL